MMYLILEMFLILIKNLLQLKPILLTPIALDTVPKGGQGVPKVPEIFEINHKKWMRRNWNEMFS